MSPIAPSICKQTIIIPIITEHGQSLALGFKKDERVIYPLGAEFKPVMCRKTLRDKCRDEVSANTFIYQQRCHYSSDSEADSLLSVS